MGMFIAVCAALAFPVVIVLRLVWKFFKWLFN